MKWNVAIVQCKKKKMEELNRKCEEAILGKFSAPYNGNTYYFSCDMEAQSNFEKVDRAFEKGRITEIGWTAYDSNGDVTRLLLTSESFEPIYIRHLEHIQGNISKFRDFITPLVMSATTLTDINDIQWNMI